METIRVVSHAGYQAEEYPLRFSSCDGRSVEILSVKKRWLTPGNKWFRVLGADNILYDLRYEIRNDTWSLAAVNRP